MTIAEKLVEKGKLEGIKEGELKGKMEAAKRMKEKGTDFNFISEITGLSIKEIEKL